MPNLLSPLRVGSGVAMGGALNRAHPLNVGKVGHWLVHPGRRGGSTWYDLAGPNHGTLAGGVTWGPTTRPGGKGELRFDGSSGQVTVPYVLTSSVASATYAALGWAYLSGTSLQGAFIKAGGPSHGIGLGVGGSTFDTPGNRLLVLAENVAWVDSGADLGTGWHHVGFGYHDPSTTLSIYLDGRLVYNAAQSVAARGDADSTWLGGYTSADSHARYFAGSLDDWAAYSRVPSVAEVATLYGLSRAGYPGILNRAGLVGSLSGATSSGAASLAPRPLRLPAAVRRASFY